MNRLIIDNTQTQIRVARLEKETLTEIAIETRENASLVGNIYAARVNNILDSRFAFLDIGAQKDAFLFLSDAKEKHIAALYPANYKNGGEILIQVVKDETPAKGACVSAQLTFSNAHFVLIKTHTDEAVSVSHKITSDDERLRLKSLVLRLLPHGYAAIIRTEAENESDDVLKQSLLDLTGECEKIIAHGKCQKAPCAVYKQENLLVKLTKRMLTRDIDKIIINNTEQEFEYYLQTSYGNVTEKLNIYNEETPLFEHFNIESQIDKALRKKVWLKSGGYIIVEQTEACAVIDVNSGKFTDGGSYEATVRKTNEQAADEVAKQARLRNLSGMIVVDFINTNANDMKNLTERLKQAFVLDRVSVKIAAVTELGVVILTRKKAHADIASVLTTECACCGGTGRIKRT